MSEIIGSQLVLFQAPDYTSFNDQIQVKSTKNSTDMV